MSGVLLEAFRRELGCAALLRGASCETWRATRRVRENLVVVKAGEPFLLYIKERLAERGFWGVTANRVRELDGSGLPWHLVLLAGSASRAHVLCARQVRERIEAGEWHLGNDGDYKVNEGERLPREARLASCEQIFGVLL